jgi:XTP/dITP diphosphohydrolase
MIKLVLASNNKKKIAELETLLTVESSNQCPTEVLSLKDIGYFDDIVEDGTTFEENSLIKAAVPAGMGYIGIADDSGLAVDYLNGAPGIFSARYAGDHGDDAKNREKLFCALDGVPMEKRTARFVCSVAVVIPKDSPLEIPEAYRISPELAEKRGLDSKKAAVIRGECEGFILTEERGEGGFGYDNMFFYPAYEKTFAEIDGEQKNAVSHRGNAMRELQVLLAKLVK